MKQKIKQSVKLYVDRNTNIAGSVAEKKQATCSTAEPL